MIGRCLTGIQQAPAEVLRLLDLSNFGEVVLAIFVFSFAFTIVAAPFARAAYRKRVTSFMSFRQVREPPAAWWQRRERLGGRAAPALSDAVDAPTPQALTDAMHRRLQRIRRATLAAYAAYVVGVAFVLPLHPWDDAAGLVVGAAALAAGPAFINATPRRGLGLVTLLVGVLLAATIVLQFDSAEDLGDTAIALGLVIAFQAVSTWRTLRALSVPLTVISIGALVGFMIGGLSVTAISACFGVAPASVETTSVTPATVITTFVVMTSGVLGVWAGSQLVASLARAHERGWISDISLVSLFGLGAGAALITFSADREGLTLAGMSAAYLAWMALPVAAYALVLRFDRAPEAARSLLVLRVFSRNRRSERLLDRLQTEWRYAGPVLQIGGPDLARLNVDPHEFARFLAGRTHELFVPADVPKAKLLAGLDLGADREGRFRVVEVFCFDSAWHSTVQTLIETSDAILLDLRGFGPQRAGTAFELVQLAAQGRLDRTVVIGDTSTDWAHFEKLAGPAVQQAVRLDAHRSDLVDTCIAALLRCGVRSAA
jgi:hypothetical protein